MCITKEWKRKILDFLAFFSTKRALQNMSLILSTLTFFER